MMEHFLLISVKAKTAWSKETCIQAKASLSRYLRPLSVPDAILSPKLGSLYITHSYLAMVSPNTLRTALGALGNITSAFLVLSPMPTFYRVWKKGSVEQFSPIPYVVTVINCMIWALYGVPVVHPHSTLVITTSGSGLVVELFYVLVFLFYSQGRKRLIVLIMLVASIIIVGIFALLVIMLVHTHERRSMIVGILGGVLGILMNAAPLSVMKMVIQTKSVEYMPLFLSVATFFNSACWGAYAFIPFDPYICIPNVVGVLLAIVQLLLYGMYYKSTQRQIEARRRKEEMAMAKVAVMGDGDNKVGMTV